MLTTKKNPIDNAAKEMMKKIQNFSHDASSASNGHLFNEIYFLETKSVMGVSCAEEISILRKEISLILASMNSKGPNEALKELGEVLNIAQESSITFPIVSSFLLGTKAYAHYLCKDYTNAEIDLYNALIINRSLTKSYGLRNCILHSMQLINNLQRIYFSQKRFSELIEISENSLKTIAGVGDIELGSHSIIIMKEDLHDLNPSLKTVMYSQIFCEYAESLVLLDETWRLFSIQVSSEFLNKSDFESVNLFKAVIQDIGGGGLTDVTRAKIIAHDFHGAYIKLVVLILHMLKSKINNADYLKFGTPQNDNFTLIKRFQNRRKKMIDGKYSVQN